MGSEPKEMKYRRRARASEPGDYGQCVGGDPGGGAVDWAALKQQDPAELLRRLDEIRDQITRSCEIARPPPPAHRMGRRAASMRPSHADPPPPPLPEYGRSRHAGRYGHGLPPSSYDHLQRSVSDDRYGRQPSGRFRPPQPRPEGQWEGYGYGGQGQGSCHQSSCQCAQCVHGQRAVAPQQEENIPMARFLAGQQRSSYLFNRSSSISSDYDRRSVASSLYSHLSMSNRRVEYFRKKAESFCRPVKGGAPFVVCSSCNQLLQLPHVKCTARKQNQVQCGSCSEIVTLKLNGMKVRPLIPSSSLTVPRSVRSSNRQIRQSSGWYPEQDDGDSSSFASHRQKQNFSVLP